MRSVSLTGVLAITAVSVVSAALLTNSVVSAQAQSGAAAAAKTAVPAPAVAPKLAAQWHLNKEMSADMHDVTAPLPGSTQMPVPVPGSYGGGGRGGYGGFGGYSGGGGPTSEKTLRDRAILREASEMPPVLNIVVDGTAITMTTDDGTVRKFNATGKKEKVDLTTAEVDSIAHWDQTTLVQEMTNGDLKLTRTWQPTENGNRLVITITTQRTKRVEPVTMKLVYDK